MKQNGTASLGDLCDFIRGVTFDKADAMPRPLPGYLPVLRAGNIGENLDTQHDLLWLPKGLVRDEQLLRRNDILICMSSGSADVVGKTCCVPSNLAATVGSFCGIIRPKNASLASFISFFFKSGGFSQHRDAIARGANIQNLRFSQLEEITIRIPDRHEVISEVLEKADRLLRMRRHAVEMDESFLDAVFLNIFGDPVRNPYGFPRVEASTLFEIQLGKMLDEKRYTGDHLRPYLGNANVQWDRFNLSSVKAMDFPRDDFDRFSLAPGDLLVCEGGEVGRTAIWRGAIPNCCYQKALHRLRRKGETILPEYFMLYMRAIVRSGVLARLSSTSTITHFTAEKFEELPVMLPPLELQQRFVDVYQDHHKLVDQHREALRQSDHLFQSLLHRSFTAKAKST